VRETERESGEGEREEEQRGRIERENSEGERQERTAAGDRQTD
jgi:hypothetical protein